LVRLEVVLDWFIADFQLLSLICYTPYNLPRNTDLSEEHMWREIFQALNLVQLPVVVYLNLVDRKLFVLGLTLI